MIANNKKPVRCVHIDFRDADFVPALKLVEKSGKKAFSAFMPKGYSFELRDKFAFRVLGRDTLTEKCLK